MTRILQTDLARDALYTKVNQIADEKVSLSEDETITGIKSFSVSPLVPTLTGGDSSSKAASTSFVTTAYNDLQTQINAKADENAVAHKSGDETLAGTKTFVRSPQVPDNTSGDSSSNAANTKFVTTADNALQTQINAKANDNAVVHLAGVETITGAKTFSSAVTLANNTWNTIGDDVQIGDMNNAGKLCIRGLNGYTGIYFYPENGNSPTNGIYLQPENYNGLLLTDTSSSRAWGSILCTDSYIQNNSEGNGYYKLGNGLIIQWGTVALNGQNWVIVRLPIAFTSTNYQVALSSAEVGWSTTVTHQTRNKTTTTFETLGQGSPLSWIAIGY